MFLEDRNLAQLLSKDDAKIYFIGIGGIAMSASACVAKELGYEVFGSDSQQLYPPAKDVVDQNDIHYHAGYSQKQAADAKADLYILSAGEDLSNPEVKYVVEHNLPRAGFAELLYELAKDSLRVVVAGTHGKSTTSGLLGHLFKNLDDSSFVAGAVLQNYQSNFSKGDGHYFVFEGDEYKNQFDDPTPKFHYYKPDILVLTNLEFDHPDQFGSLEELENEFAQLIDALPEDGLIVYNADDANLSKLVHRSNITAVSFGIDNGADFKAENIQYGQHTAISVSNNFSKDQVAKLLAKDEDYQIQLPGKMNVYNALAGIATLRTLGFTRENIALDLLSYQGVKRRFEVVGVKNGITVVDDYAHHPTAVRETLQAARLRYFTEAAGNRGEGSDVSHQNAFASTRAPKLWAVFEPHTFSRTKALLPDLAKSFADADEVLISEIYPARESAKDSSITTNDVVRAVAAAGGRQKVRLVHDKAEALSIIKKEAQKGDVVVVMAVGSFNRLAYELKEMI